MSWDPSVLPLSATITSAEIPRREMAPCAFRTQVSKVSASLRQGSTTLNVRALGADVESAPETAGDGARLVT